MPDLQGDQGGDGLSAVPAPFPDDPHGGDDPVPGPEAPAERDDRGDDDDDGWATRRQVCDVCRFQAYYMVVLESGNLFFCGHHYRRNEVALYEVALEVVDESELMGGRRPTGPS